MPNKRSITNITQTSKYHMLYVGNILFVSLGLVALMYLLILHRIVEVTVGQEPEVIRQLVGAVTLGAIFLGVLITFVALLSAHRVSGVHIKLKSTFDRVSEGDFTTELRFRKNDKLTDVEESFNRMMEVVRNRIEPSTTDPK